MFKKLQKSVIDKNKLLITNLNKRRVNKTPSKIIFPKRTNLTFANIIVNMNSTPNFSNSIDNWSNSYFTTEVYNNSFINKSKNDINNIKQNNREIKDDHSKILSILINGIVSLKANDLLNYCMKLIDIVVYIRDNSDKNNCIDINNEINKNLLIIIYQTYFHIFPENSIISKILRDDLNNGKKILKNIHYIYIFFLLSGIIYINNNLKPENRQLYDYLKQFIKKEKCKDINCPLCNKFGSFEKNFINYNSQSLSPFSQKPSVIKIKDNYIKRNYISKNKFNKKINKVCNISQKIKNDKINKSNDNIIKKTNKNSKSHNKEKSFNKNNLKGEIEKTYYSYISRDRNENKLLDKKRIKEDIHKNNKKIFYSQIIKAKEKDKNKFFNNSFNKREKSNSKNKYKINIENNILDNSYNINNYTENNQRFLTEISENKSQKKIQNDDFSNMIKNIKIKLYKNNKPKKKIENNTDKKNKNIEYQENNNFNNNKIIEINDLFKNKKIKINFSNDINNKNYSKRRINSDDSEKKNEHNNADNKEYMEINSNLNKSSLVIKENINSIEKDIKEFKNHNSFIKKQLLDIFKNTNTY